MFEILEKTVRNNQAVLTRFVFGLLRNRFGESIATKEFVEDVLSEAFVRAVVLIRGDGDSPKTEKEMVAWILKICTYVSLELARKRFRKNQVQLSDDEMDFLQYQDEIEFLDDNKAVLTDLITKLERDEQQLVRMYFEDFLSTRQIAETLNLSQATVRKRKSRVLKKLRRLLLLEGA